MLEFELFGFIPSRTVFLIGHILGVALGAGGAYMSDLMYMSSVKDKVINATEHRFLKIGSAMVWIGLLVLIVSGLLLFSLRPEELLLSSKFMAKLTVIAVIILNGLIFHFIHTPLLGRVLGKQMHKHREFKRRSLWVYVSGAVSMVSWTTTLILGTLRSVPYSYNEIMSVYVGIVCIAIVISLMSRHLFFYRKK